MREFTYHVNVGANVSDESGGNLYAMLIGSNAEITKNDVSDLTERMFQLGGEFQSGSINQVSTDITSSFANLDDFNSNVSTALAPATEYHLYMYAIDTLDNDVLIKYDKTVILSVESTKVSIHTDYLLGTTDNVFYEFRSLDVITQPNISSEGDGGSYFGFKKNLQNYADVLYSNIFVESGEFAIDNVYAFALEEPFAVAGNESGFISLVENMTPSKQYSLLHKNSDVFSYEVDTFYSNVTSITTTPMRFGTTYTMYNAFHDRGTNTTVVKRSDQVVTGTYPTITDTKVIVDNTEKDFITSITCEYTEGNVEIITVIDKLNRTDSITLFTIVLGYAVYDRDTLLGLFTDNTRTVLERMVPEDGNDVNQLVTEVQDIMGVNVSVSEVNAIFVYQLATVARSISEINEGAPSSDLTNLSGNVVYQSESPLVLFSESNITMYHYESLFEYYIFKFDSSTIDLSNETVRTFIEGVHHTFSYGYNEVNSESILYKGKLAKAKHIVLTGITSFTRVFANVYDSSKVSSSGTSTTYVATIDNKGVIAVTENV